MNLLVYAYNGTIFFKLFTAQDLTPILNKMSNDYVTRMSRDDRQLTFCANKRGEWEWSVVQDSGLSCISPVPGKGSELFCPKKVTRKAKWIHWGSSPGPPGKLDYKPWANCHLQPSVVVAPFSTAWSFSFISLSYLLWNVLGNDNTKLYVWLEAMGRWECPWVRSYSIHLGNDEGKCE